MANAVENFENMLLELCDLCSQNKPSLLGKIGVKQAKLVEMFKEGEKITLNQSGNSWISVDDRDNPPPYQQEVIVYLYNKTEPKKSYVTTERFVSDYPHKPKSHVFNWGIMNTDYEVLYWQLLPQPPKE